jgi:hypothetical protein
MIFSIVFILNNICIDKFSSKIKAKRINIIEINIIEINIIEINHNDKT